MSAENNINFSPAQSSTDQSKIRQLAEQALHRPVSDIRPLGGYISYNYLVNQDTIFKLASSRSNLSDWYRLAANAPIIQQHLSVQIPIPALHFLNDNGKIIPALSYQQLPGQPISRRDFATRPEAFKQSFFEQVTDCIHQLHQIPPEILPVKPPNAFEESACKLFRDKKSQVRFAKIAKYFFLNHVSPTVLLHADLHTENICFDGNKIVGLLDFDTLCTGHPSFEFRPMLYQKPEDLQKLVHYYSQRYPSELDPALSRNFIKKFNMIFKLFWLINYLKPQNAKRTTFEQIVQTHIQQEKRNRS